VHPPPNQFLSIKQNQAAKCETPLFKSEGAHGAEGLLLLQQLIFIDTGGTGRTKTAMGCRSCEKPKMNYRKGLWSPEEDQRLRDYILKHGLGCWSAVSAKAGELLFALVSSCYMYLLLLGLLLVLNFRLISDQQMHSSVE
jgi:hypothetical protein